MHIVAWWWKPRHPRPSKCPSPTSCLQLLIVALDAPAQFGEVNQISKGNVLRKGRKPVFGRLVFSFWPLDQQPFLRSQLGAPFVAMRGANPQACKARAQRFGCAIAPCNRAPSPLRQAERERLDRDWSVLGVAPHQFRRASATRPRLRRQRPHALRPYRGRRQNPGCVGQAQRRDVGAQRAVIAIAGVQQRHAARQPGRAGETQLLKRDLRLGLEHEAFRNARLAPARGVIRPLLRQIQLPGHRQARMAIGQRQ